MKSLLLMVKSPLNSIKSAFSIARLVQLRGISRRCLACHLGKGQPWLKGHYIESWQSNLPNLNPPWCWYWPSAVTIDVPIWRDPVRASRPFCSRWHLANSMRSPARSGWAKTSFSPRDGGKKAQREWQKIIPLWIVKSWKDQERVLPLALQIGWFEIL